MKLLCYIWLKTHWKPDSENQSSRDVVYSTRHSSVQYDTASTRHSLECPRSMYYNWHTYQKYQTTTSQPTSHDVPLQGQTKRDNLSSIPIRHQDAPGIHLAWARFIHSINTWVARTLHPLRHSPERYLLLYWGRAWVAVAGWWWFLPPFWSGFLHVSCRW